MTKYDFAMLEIFDSVVSIKEQGEVKMMNSVKAFVRNDPATIRACEYCVKLRDYYTMRAEYCSRLWASEGINKDFSPCEVAYEQILNLCLPLHYRRSEAQQEDALEEAMSMRMPSLKRRLKFLHQQLKHYEPRPQLNMHVCDSDPLAPSAMTAEKFM